MKLFKFALLALLLVLVLWIARAAIAQDNCYMTKDKTGVICMVIPEEPNIAVQQVDRLVSLSKLQAAMTMLNEAINLILEKAGYKFPVYIQPVAPEVKQSTQTTKLVRVSQVNPPSYNGVFQLAATCNAGEYLLRDGSCYAAHYYRSPEIGDAVLNDRIITPGGFSHRTAAELCAPSFRTKAIRSVTPAVKRHAWEAYKIPQANRNGKKYELDHLLSLELGGDNSIDNIWPEPYAPNPGAKEKDAVENYLRVQMCLNVSSKGKSGMTLDTVQQGITTNWYVFYPAAKKYYADRKKR